MNLRSITIIILHFLILSVSCKNSDNQQPVTDESIQDTVYINETAAPQLVFGIPSDSFNLITDHIRRNEFLSQILLRHGVSMKEIDQVVRNYDSIFDVRKVRSGNHYTLFCEQDSAGRAKYLVYEHDPTTCYIFSFNDSLTISTYRKEINKVLRFSSGIIETSLWESMLDSGIHYSLAVELSEIFAWTVDFFGLQKGDTYKVIYELSLIHISEPTRPY